MELLSLIGTGIAIAVSAVTAYIALKKSKPEVEKTKAEILEIYADELRKLKEENQKERETSQKERSEYFVKITELERKIYELSNKLNILNVERKEEELKYREFINELLLGISRLTGQIQNRDEIPVWSPPQKTPFDCD